jgi:hypothetical protein
VRIFKGGSSVSAPGRGGRLLRAMMDAIWGCEGDAIEEAFATVFELVLMERGMVKSCLLRGQMFDAFGLAVGFLPSRVAHWQSFDDEELTSSLIYSGQHLINDQLLH